MRKLLILWSALMLIAFNACAKNNQKHTTQGAVMAKTNTEIFGNKPIYKLRVNAENVVIKAKINGVDIYENFSGNKAFSLETVNDLITSTDNTMSMMLMAKGKLNPKARAKLTLEVYAQGKHYILNSIYVDLSQKKITQGSTPPHEYSYDSKQGMIRDIKGKIIVGETTVEKFNSYRRGSVDGLNIVQHFSLPTPFPRWKFLDSPNIIDETYDYIDTKEHAKLKKTPKIQALYALDAKIRNALKAKHPEKIIDLFAERFEESAYAFYDTPQSLKKELMDDFMETVNDPNKEFIERKGDDLYFVIEENKKLAWLNSISFYDKESGIYSHYRIKYRLNKQGEWVITK
jgi:hypothetical protein